MSDVPPSAPSAPASAPATPAAPSAPAASPNTQATPPAASAAPVGETPAEKKARIHRIKVDGVEEDLDLDKLTDEDHVKNAQWAKAARRRMQEAAETKKSFQAIVEQMKKDPFSLSKLHPEFKDLDLRKAAEDRLVQEFQESQMDEPTRRANQLQRELEAERARTAEFENQQKTVKQQQLEERVFQETQRDFISALEASDLPKTKETLFQMAQVAQIAFENGLELSPRQIADEVKKKQAAMHQQLTRGLTGEKLINHLGPEVVRAVLQYSLDKAKGRLPGTPGATKPPVEQPAVTDLPDKPERKPQDYQAARKFFRR